MNVRGLLYKIVQFARVLSGYPRIVPWVIYTAFGGSILALVASFASCTYFDPIERLKGQYSAPDLSTGTWNRQPLGGADEKSNRSPCESAK